MADKIPNELLSDVLEYLHYTSASSHNLHNAILVGKRWSQVGTKILYKAPRFLKLRCTDGAGWENSRHRQTQRLLRTLIRRPELANTVKELDLTVVSTEILVYEDTLEGKKDLENFGVTAKKFGRYFSKEWETKLCAGHEPAAAGLLLALLPGLRHFTIDSICQTIIDPNEHRPITYRDDSLPYRAALQRRILDPLDWYACRNLDASILSELSGFANLSSITTSSKLPWQIVALPCLKTLEMAVDFSPIHWYAKALEVPYGAVSPSIETLRLRLHWTTTFVMVYEPNVCKEYEYVQNVVSRLVNLQTLFLELGGTMKEEEDDKYSFESILSWLPAPTITNLTIQDSGVLPSDSVVSERMIDPLESLSQYPNLRQVTAPYTALAFMGRLCLTICELPDSVAIVRISDGKTHLMACLRSALLDKGKFPNIGSVDFLPDLTGQQQQSEFFEQIEWDLDSKDGDS
jgi:hypothetical protein